MRMAFGWAAAVALLSAILSTPVSAQAVRASAGVDGFGMERGTFYYNNETVIWHPDGNVTHLPGILSPSQSVHVATSAGDAFAYADISRGKVGASAIASGASYAGARASFYDYVTFDVGGVSAETVTPIRFIATLHSVTPQFYDAWFSVGLGSAHGTFLFRNQLGNYWHTDIGGAGLAAFNTWVDGTTQYFDFTYNLVGPVSTHMLGMDLRVQGGGGFGTDMSQTAALKFVLPQAVSFTSSTGALLQAAVPEPTSWIMMVIGFGMVGAATRRRTAAVSLA